MLAEDEPARFASSAMELHQTETLWATIRSAAAHRVALEHSEKVFAERLHELLDDSRA
jgi:hypothetical protein